MMADDNNGDWKLPFLPKPGDGEIEKAGRGLQDVPDHYSAARQRLALLCQELSEFNPSNYETSVNGISPLRSRLSQEQKHIRYIDNQARAIEYFARMVKDRDLEHAASAVRCMAKIRLGKAIREMQDRNELYKRGGDRKSNSHADSLKKTLKAHGIDWRESAICQRLAEKSPEQQEEIIKDIRLGVTSVNTVMRAQMLDESRLKKCIEANRKATMKPDDPEFCVIYADPAWDYGGDPFPNHPEASPANHYRTAGEDTTAAEGGGKKKRKSMKEVEDEIAGFLEAKKIKVHERAVLFMWATVPLIEMGLRIVKKWGFEYKTMLVWDKQKDFGLGSWLPIQTELLLVGTKGGMPSPRVENRNKIESNFRSEVRTGHSAKPHYFPQLIETLYPENKTRIELYARPRNRRAGWWAIGDELDGGIQPPPDVNAGSEGADILRGGVANGSPSA
jgi:N6-adenosine-specific RNA methylase IME4